MNLHTPLALLGLIWSGAAWAQPASQPASQPALRPPASQPMAPGSQPAAGSQPLAMPAAPADPWMACLGANQAIKSKPMKSDARRKHVMRTCAGLFKLAACRSALSGAEPPEGDPKSPIARCAKAYCAVLEAPKPGVCEEAGFKGGVQARAGLVRRALIQDHSVKPLPLDLEARMATLDRLEGPDASKRWQAVQADFKKLELTERQRQMWGISFVLALLGTG